MTRFLGIFWWAYPPGEPRRGFEKTRLDAPFDDATPKARRTGVDRDEHGFWSGWIIASHDVADARRAAPGCWSRTAPRRCERGPSDESGKPLDHEHRRHPGAQQPAAGVVGLALHRDDRVRRRLPRPLPGPRQRVAGSCSAGRRAASTTLEIGSGRTRSLRPDLRQRYAEQPDPVARLEDPACASRSGRASSPTTARPVTAPTRAGGKGYPNLTDERLALRRRTGDDRRTPSRTDASATMPALGASDRGRSEVVRDMAQYVLSLSGREHDAEAAARPGGAEVRDRCARACHGPTARATPLVGAPNLNRRRLAARRPGRSTSSTRSRPGASTRCPRTRRPPDAGEDPPARAYVRVGSL